MRRLLALRPSPAMVVACIALIVALGGTGYAAITLPRNSVGTKQLKANAVTGGKVRDGSLTARDFGGLPRGPRGPEGPRGTQGSAGDSTTGGGTRIGFASRDPYVLGGGVPIALNGAWSDLVGLSTPAGTGAYGASSGLVGVSGPSRLIASGEAVIVNAAGARGFVRCRLLLVGAAARELGNYISVRIPVDGEIQVGVSGGSDVEADSYDVRLQCASGDPLLTFHRGNVIVSASAR